MNSWPIPLYRPNRPNRPSKIVLSFLILCYIWLFTTLAFDQHMGMRTHKADLGQIDQAIWNSSQVRFVETTDNGFVATRMTDHVEPILALISPIFWLWNDVRALLLLQVIFVAVGTWLVYGLAEDKGGTIPIVIAIAYLMTPQLQSALLTEFHAAPLAVPFILWAFWSIDRGNWQQTLLAILLTASVKEEMALLAVGLGIWGVWRFKIDDLHTDSPYGALTALIGITVLSLVWFITATFIIVPAHAVEVYGTAESTYFKRYGALGDSPLDIFGSFFTQPKVVWQIITETVRLNYLWYLIAPFGFLSLLAPEILLLALPLLLANLLSAYPAQYYGEFHYSAPLVPYFVVSAIYGMRRLTNLRLNRLGLPLLAIWILCWAIVTYIQLGSGPGAGRYDPTPITNHHHLLQRLIKQIPTDAAVTATAAVHPHVSHRRYVYQFPIGLDIPTIDHPAEWALLDVTTATDMAPGDVKYHVDNMLADGWGVEEGIDGFLLLRRGGSMTHIPDTFYDFARREAEPMFEENLQPLKFIATIVEDWPRWRQTKITTQWQVGQNFADHPVIPALEIRTPTGHMLYTMTDLMPPVLLWYPPKRWQTNEVIQITSLPLYLPRRWGIVVKETAHMNAPWMLAQAYERSLDDRLSTGIDIQKLSLGTLTSGSFRFMPEDNTNSQHIELQAEVLESTTWLGAVVNLRLRWDGIDKWPANLTPFVHLRQDDRNLSQNDGLPRFFVFEDSSMLLEKQGFLDDWRQLAVPLSSDARVGDVLQVVVGLYDPRSGRRADLLDIDGQLNGTELFVDSLKITSPPILDQTCALIAATCD